MDWDWLSWLSKSALNPTLVHEYGLAFALNQLEEDDISYFDHPFLQSMGISVAKHRLEILKLVHNHIHMHSHRRNSASATTYNNNNNKDSNWRRNPVTLTTTRLLVRSVSQLLKLTRRRMGGFLNNLIRPAHLQDHEEVQSSLILVPSRSSCNNRSFSPTAGGGATWRGDVIVNGKSRRQLSGSSSTKMEKRTLLVLTSGGGSSCPPSPAKVPKRSFSFPASPAVVVNSHRLNDKKKNSNNNNGGEEKEMMRWDSLFRDLRPT